MTRKDYQLIANRLAMLQDDIQNYRDACTVQLDFDRFVSDLCFDLKQDNSNFNSAKFREKVYGK
jgi:hypothetical protein